MKATPRNDTRTLTHAIPDGPPPHRTRTPQPSFIRNRVYKSRPIRFGTTYDWRSRSQESTYMDCHDRLSGAHDLVIDIRLN